MSTASDICTKDILDRMTDQAARSNYIGVNCSSKFDYVNMVDVYYNSTNQSGIAMLLIILIFYPILFVGLATIADRYLALDMKDLAHKFNLSPTLAAVTLIVFANGAPDILSAVQASSFENGNFVSLGALYGAFIFSSTLVISYVTASAEKDIKLPKLAVIKELCFYLLSIIVVLIFGYIGRTGWPFVIAFWFIYGLYCLMTFYLEKRYTQLEHIKDELEDEEVQNTIHELQTEENRVSVADYDNCSDNDSGIETQPMFFTLVVDKLVDEECSMLENIIALPLNLAAFITISDLDNPFMYTKAELLICAVSFCFAIVVFDFLPISFYWLLIASLLIAIIVYFGNHSPTHHEKARLTYQLMGVMSSIAWIKIFSGFVIDFITFIAFYFAVNEVIISSILLSAGNTVGDFFGNAALARAGEEVMATMATYSVQIFNMILGFSFNVLISMKVTDEFDLFNRHKKADFNNIGIGFPLQNIFVLAMMALSAFIIIVNMIYYIATGFVLKKWFSFILFSIYFVFFVGALGLGVVNEAN